MLSPSQYVVLSRLIIRENVRHRCRWVDAASLCVAELACGRAGRKFACVHVAHGVCVVLRIALWRL